MVKCLPKFKYFYCVLEKKKTFISKIRSSEVTDYAALKKYIYIFYFLDFIQSQHMQATWRHSNTTAFYFSFNFMATVCVRANFVYML